MLTRIVAFVAAIQCAPEMAVHARIILPYGEEQQETQRIAGVTVESYANRETGTYTLLAVADGTACIIATGKDWRGQPISAWLTAA